MFYKNLPNATTFTIVDILGKPLETILVPQVNGAIKVNTSNYAAGIYLIVAKSDGVIIKQTKLILK